MYLNAHFTACTHQKKSTWTIGKYKQSCKLLEEYIQEHLYMIEEFGETFSGQPNDRETMKEKQY